jgi:glycosyltransferase involved in cell wall biosynthesis
MEKIEHQNSIKQQIKLLVVSSLYPEDKSDMSNVFEKRLNHYLKEKCSLSIAAYSFQTKDKYQVDGIDVFSIHIPEIKEYPEKGFFMRNVLYCFHLLHREFLRFIKTYSVLRQLNKKMRFDVLLMASFSVFGIYALPFAKRYKIPLFVQCGGYDVQVIPSINYGIRRNRLFRFYSNIVLKHADLLLSNSKGFIDDTILKDIKTPKYVLSRGIDSEEFKLSKKRRSKSEKDKIEILSVGGLRKVKGWELILKVAELLKHEKGIKFTIIGRDDDIDEFNKIVVEKGLDNVTFFGKVNPAKMRSHYEESDIYLHPSYSEGIGNTLLEASAMELPLVASGLGGVKDIVVDGSNGYYIGSREPKAFAEKIIYLADHPEKRFEMGRNARERVIEKFDWKRIVADFSDFLAQHLGTREKEIASEDRETP